MEKKTVSGIMLTLLLTSMLTLAFNIQPVKAEGGGSPWITQTLDSVGNVGVATSLAFDFSGNPAISYGDVDNYDLKYVCWDGNNWVIEIVDSSGSQDPNKFYPQTSLAFDSVGNPAISYYNGYPYYDLKYAHWNGISWDTQVVLDDKWGTGWTRTTSLAFDKNGNPAIAFRYMYVGLKYAYWDGTSWKIETVDSGYGTGAYCSFRFDSWGNPAIAYWWQGVYEGPSNLRYAYFSGTVWNIKIVDDNPGASYPSLAFDSSGNPAISYYDSVQKNLKYIRWNGVSWSVQVVDSNVGKYSSLAFDRSGNPAISYYDSTNKDLKYAYFDGSKWNTEIVDSLGDVGTFSSLAFYPSGEPAISYYDATNGDLKYATLKVVPPVPEEWSFAIITDLHIGFGYPDYGTENWSYDNLGDFSDYYLTDRLKEIVKTINNRNVRFVVVLGDISDTAEYSEFLKAREILSVLNDPNGDGNTSDGIPYIPVIGNHDVWPYTQKAEVEEVNGYEFNPDGRYYVENEWPSEQYPPVGDQYFAEVFWDERYNRMNIELIRKFFNSSFKRQLWILDEPYLQNYVFKYNDVKFVVLDCITRQHILGEAGVGADAELFPRTLQWLRENLQSGEATILFSHHPMVGGGDNLLFSAFAFSEKEIEDIRKTISDNGAKVLATFAGHTHGNLLFSSTSIKLGLDVVITEAVLRESKPLLEEWVTRTGNNIRIVRMIGESIKDYGYLVPGWADEPENLRPISYFVYKPKDPVVAWWFFNKIEFKATPYNPDGSISKYEWDFGDGTRKTGRKVEHGYPRAGEYIVTLTVTDDGMPQESSSFSRKVTVRERKSIWESLLDSLADLIVTDPNGVTLTKDVGEVAGMSYVEVDVDGDGELEDVVAVWERKIGDYLIMVIPEPDADSTDTYTLKVWTEGITTVLTESTQIDNIPTQPYVVRSTKTEIIPIIPATVDFDPDTLNLRSKGEWLTAYIELPVGHGYDVNMIDLASVMLNNQVQAEAKPIQIGDYDSDGIPDLMVKFNQTAVQNILDIGDKVEITISGKLTDGRLFEGKDTIKVIFPP